MFPEICRIGPVTVYSYGLMLVIAFLVGTYLACRQAVKTGISPDLILNLNFTAFFFGALGARLFYVAENFSYYLANPLEIFMLQHGGLSWFGGLILGSVAAFIYLKKRKAPIYKVLDLVVPFLALAQAIGRIGCLLNGCCFGKASAFGLYFPVHNATLIPAQAYSSLLLLLIYIILRYMQERPHRQGGIFFAYLLFYSIKRFFIEFYRADNKAILWDLSLFQLLSIAVFFLSLSGIFMLRNKRD